MRALLSVYDKDGLIELARGLVDLGHELVASGGTATALAAAGIPHVTVESVTGAPEMLGGRVPDVLPAAYVVTEPALRSERALVVPAVAVVVPPATTSSTRPLK